MNSIGGERKMTPPMNLDLEVPMILICLLHFLANLDYYNLVIKLYCMYSKYTILIQIGCNSDMCLIS